MLFNVVNEKGLADNNSAPFRYAYSMPPDTVQTVEDDLRDAIEEDERTQLLAALRSRE
jgi:hypothetical protein